MCCSPCHAPPERAVVRRRRTVLLTGEALTGTEGSPTPVDVHGRVALLDSMTGAAAGPSAAAPAQIRPHSQEDSYERPWPGRKYFRAPRDGRLHKEIHPASSSPSSGWQALWRSHDPALKSVMSSAGDRCILQPDSLRPMGLRKWAADGTWEKVFTALVPQPDTEVDLDWVVAVNSIVVPAPPACRPGPVKKARPARHPIMPLGRSRSGLTTKIHLDADDQCRPPWPSSLVRSRWARFVALQRSSRRCRSSQGAGP